MKSVEKVLREVFENPTAPYRENWVLDFVKNELKKMKVPYFVDRWGNIIAGVGKPSHLRRSCRVGLMAHTDHPGFHLSGRRSAVHWNARWFGGCPPKIFRSKVAIHHPQFPGEMWSGKIVSRKLAKKTRTFQIKLESLKNANRLDDTCFGAFQFPGYSKRGHRISTRAADDLSGVTIILSTFARLNARERGKIFGIFTRAEEVGFRGALGVIYGNFIGPRNKVISLEASRQLPGARLGRGPVIRLGDKKTLFDSALAMGLDEAAGRLQKRNKKFTVQRRIMNGGTCEATPFNLYGIPAAGIAVPLGNYHNERATGTPGAEYIDLRDVESAIRLCVEFYRQVSRGSDPKGRYLGQLETGFKKDGPLLRRRITFQRRSH